MGARVCDIRKETAGQLPLDIQIPLLNISRGLCGVGSRSQRRLSEGIRRSVGLRISARRNGEGRAERTRSSATKVTRARSCQNTVAGVQSTRRGQPLIV